MSPTFIPRVWTPELMGKKQIVFRFEELHPPSPQPGLKPPGGPTLGLTQDESQLVWFPAVMGTCGSVSCMPSKQQFVPPPNLGSPGSWSWRAPSASAHLQTAFSAHRPHLHHQRLPRNSVTCIKSTPKYFLWNIQKMLIRQYTKPNGSVPEHLQERLISPRAKGDRRPEQSSPWWSVPLVTIYSIYRNIPNNPPPTRRQDFKEDPVPPISNCNATEWMYMLTQALFLQKENTSAKANQTKLPRTAPLATHNIFVSSNNSNFIK